MRRRSTFVHEANLEIDSRQLYVSGDRFVIEDLRSAREERLTFGYDELPQELKQVLSKCHELHIRWASQLKYNANSPFDAKTSPGLHIFYTPLQGQSGDLLCPQLRQLFSSTLKCESPLTTFTTSSPLSPTFASTSAFQYYSSLPSLRALTQYVQRVVCQHSDAQCIDSASLLNIVDTLDINYDSISHTLTFALYWSKPPPVLYNPASGEVTENAWSLTVNSSLGAGKVEVGVFSSEPPADPSEIKLSGFLAVVGEDDAPRATLFSFPSRHHVLPPSQASQQQYTISFLRPTGLHPTMHISFPNSSALTFPSNRPADSVCALHTYLTLPSAVFADKYQLSTSDQLFLQSHNLAALRSISGETDLEAPDYMIQKWGSNVLLELVTPLPRPRSSPPSPPPPFNITIPLHTRYLPPSSSAGNHGQTPVSIPWPVVFWACTASEGTKFPVNPFDRVNLGFDGLFGSRTMFYHLDAKPLRAQAPLVETIQVPVLDLNAWGAQWVQTVTVAVVLMGFLWVCAKVWWAGVDEGERSAIPDRRSGGVQKKEEKKEQ